MRRLTPLAVILLATVAGTGGCGASDKAAAASGGSQVKELRYQGWANSVTLPELAQDLGYLGDAESGNCRSDHRLRGRAACR